MAGTDDSATIATLMSDTADAVYDYFGQLLDRRAAHPCDDLATRLVEATIDGEALSRNEMLDILFLQMSAGLDTVTASLDCVLTRLAEDPALQERARTDLEQRRLIIEELLRVESPVSMVFRYATEDVDLHGTPIKRGDMVMMLLGAANTDERAFADPLAVDPARDNTRHMVFGGGIHRCMGSHLARLETGVALEELFAALGTFKVPPNKEVSFMPGIRTATTLPVRWESPSLASAVR